jgi:putative peptidoglycan lipid II flippase
MNILKAVGSFGSLTLLSRILGYFRDILIAIFIGTSSLADAFFVAFRLPNTFRRLFAEGTFNAAFIPIYTKLSMKNRSENFTNSVINYSFATYYHCGGIYGGVYFFNFSWFRK